MINQDIIKKIAGNFIGINAIMENELKLYTNHPTLAGSAREDFWEEYFRRIIPEKYTLVRNIIVMDSDGNVSKEVDLAIVDRQYTPYIFNYGNLKFVPIEAVAVVIEAKSKSIVPKDLISWSKSIKNLKTCNVGMVRMTTGLTMGMYTGAQDATRPLVILASMFPNLSKANKEKLSEYFDIMIYFKKCKMEYHIPNEDRTLTEWIDDLNGNFIKSKSEISSNKFKNLDKELDKEVNTLYSELLKKVYGDKVGLDKKFECKHQMTLSDLKIPNNPLLSLNFQLNQLLMLINNPMLFPHYAYATLFKKHLEEKEDTNALKTNLNSRNKRKTAQKRRRV